MDTGFYIGILSWPILESLHKIQFLLGLPAILTVAHMNKGRKRVQCKDSRLGVHVKGPWYRRWRGCVLATSGSSSHFRDDQGLEELSRIIYKPCRNVQHIPQVREGLSGDPALWFRGLRKSGIPKIILTLAPIDCDLRYIPSLMVLGSLPLCLWDRALQPTEARRFSVRKAATTRSRPMRR